MLTAVEADVQRLCSSPPPAAFDMGELGPLGHLWPRGFGEWPDWYRRLFFFSERLTSVGECWTVLDMPSKDPALRQTFDAFEGARLPKPPLIKLSGLAPAEGLEVLRILEKYLDGVGDHLINAVRFLLSDLRGKSFTTLDETKEFTARVQSILDRTNYAVECPTCGEPGRLAAAPRRGFPAGVFRVRHGVISHGGAKGISQFTLVRMADEAT